jgi:hypothetical protein
MRIRVRKSKGIGTATIPLIARTPIPKIKAMRNASYGGTNELKNSFQFSVFLFRGCKGGEAEPHASH